MKQAAKTQEISSGSGILEKGAPQLSILVPEMLKLLKSCRFVLFLFVLSGKPLEVGAISQSFTC